MAKYAERTEVSADKSKTEIERTLARYGADGFAYGWEGAQTTIYFKMRGRRVRYMLALPARSEFELTPSGNLRTSDAAIDAAWEQAQRQRWRALLLVIKAKLEAVEAGITSFEDEFLAATLLDKGMTVSEWIQPQIEETYKTGKFPALLPGVADAPKLLALPEPKR